MSKTSTVASTTRPTQKALLGVGIKRKNGETAGSSSSIGSKIAKDSTTGSAELTSLFPSITTNQFDKGQLKCIAILPGIGPYTESSDSEMSSGSEDEPDNDNHAKYDLMGCKRQKKKNCQDD